jgi:hypothetical protein
VTEPNKAKFFICGYWKVYYKKIGDTMDKGIVALILGIVSFFFGVIPIIGQIVSIIAIVLGAKAMKEESSKTQAIIGLILGIIGLLSGLVVSGFLVMGMYFTASMYEPSSTPLQRMTGDLEKMVAQKARNSGELLYLGNYEYNMQKGSPEQIILGVTNPGASKKCVSTTFECTSGPCDDLDYRTFDSIQVSSGETKIMHGTLTSPVSGGMMGRIVVYEFPPERCGLEYIEGAEEYASKDIILNII